TGAFLCALLGPTLGAVAIIISEMVHDHEYSGRAAVSALSVLPWVLPVAVLVVGPGAFVLGGLGALVIQFMSARVRSAKALVLQTTVLGLVFGGAVPVFVDLVYAAFGGSRNKNFETGLLPLGAAIGLVSAAVVCWLLRRMRLLSFQRSDDSEAA
ncbi:MAG: hypothetical protein WA671_07140, partial [Candidatus Sulfotelmatobacter sp.]